MRLRLRVQERRDTPLRFSALGTPDRKLWYEAHGEQREQLSSKTHLKFLYGDIIEQLVLFLCKEAGHEVTHEQHEVEVDGVLGHIDAIVDGVVVDVKSASPYGFKKFEDGSLFETDSFGYIPQICGYSNVLTPGQGPAFIAFDKVSAGICILPVSQSIASENKPEPRIEHQKKVIAGPLPPRCYEDVPDGKSGNRKLGTECSYCVFKDSCWPGLRTFLYSGGPRFLTVVSKVPEVREAFKGE